MRCGLYLTKSSEPTAISDLVASRRHLLDKYKTCDSAEAVSAMQEEILAELEKSYDESRRTAGKHQAILCISKRAPRNGSLREQSKLLGLGKMKCIPAAFLRSSAWIHTKLGQNVIFLSALETCVFVGGNGWIPTVVRSAGRTIWNHPCNRSHPSRRLLTSNTLAHSSVWLRR